MSSTSGPTTNTIGTMEVIRPLSDGIIAMAVMSAMASMMAMATSTTVSAAGLHTMGSFVPYVGGGRKRSTGESSNELDSLNERIRKLNYVLENQREAVRGTRGHKVKLMKQYGLGVLPSVVEMKKYPKLRMTDYYLRKAEQDLDKMELNMMNLQKERKELQMKLGMRPDEGEGVRRVYPALKKFRPPPGLGD